MSGHALILVLIAASAHALWNLYIKRAAHAGIAFLWLCSALGTLLYALPALWLAATTRVSLGVVEGGFILGSVVIHTVYLGLLQRGYAVGDLSVVYPVARGLGPVLAIAGATLILGERPSAQAAFGGLGVCAAVTVLGITSRTGVGTDRQTLQAVGYAGLTGVSIACYTLWDAYAVTELAVAPLLFTWIGGVIRLALLTPVVVRRRSSVLAVWREHRTAVLAVATLAPAAYLLVLVAFTLAPVSYVAPLRELSIVIGTGLGARLLAEGSARIRMVMAAAVVVGVILVVTG